MNWYLKVLGQYADFSGRARRKEYWIFFVTNFLIGFALGFFTAMLKGPKFVPGIYNLAVLLPSFAVGVRRMHDTEHSGWWILCPIYNFVLLCTEGDTGTNSYGADPKAEGPAATVMPLVPRTNVADAEMRKLIEMRAKGLVTEEEFQRKTKYLKAG